MNIELLIVIGILIAGSFLEAKNRKLKGMELVARVFKTTLSGIWFIIPAVLFWLYQGIF